MKKINYLLGAIVSATIISCGTDEAVVHYPVSMPDSAKTIEMTNFRNSIIEMMKFNHSVNQPNTLNNKKLEESTQEILIADAKKLLLANGININELQLSSKNDNSKIISIALKLYAEKTKATIKN